MPNLKDALSTAISDQGFRRSAGRARDRKSASSHRNPLGAGHARDQSSPAQRSVPTRVFTAGCE